MAREEKRIELKPVDDAPVEKSPVHRLESDETRQRAKPVRLSPSPGEPKVSQRLDLPIREEIEMRTHQPGIEALIESDAGNPDLNEANWGKASVEQRHIPWGWFALIALGLIGAVFWSLSQVSESDKQAVQVREETATVLKNDAAEEREATQMIDRIESAVRRFFRAGSIDEMAPLVRQAERVRPLMEDFYARNPITRQENIVIHRLEPLTLDHRGNFWVATVEFENHQKRNLIIDVPQSGEPRIDWETLVCYQPMDWDKFATERPANTSLDFRVFVEQDNFFSHEFADSSQWVCFRLTALGSDDAVFGYTRTTDDLSRKILELRQQNQGRPCSLILRVNIPENLQSRSGVIIERIMSPRWLYIDAPDSGS